MTRHKASKDRNTCRQVFLSSIVNFKVIYLDPTFSEGIMDTFGALTATGLRFQTPQEDFIARLQAELADRFIAHCLALRIQGSARIAETYAFIGVFGLVEACVLAGYNDAIFDGGINQRFKGVIARVSHHGDPVWVRCRGSLE